MTPADLLARCHRLVQLATGDDAYDPDALAVALWDDGPALARVLAAILPEADGVREALGESDRATAIAADRLLVALDAATGREP